MTGPAADADDPYLWLEAIEGPQVDAWIGARNDETKHALCDAQFDRDRSALLALLNADDRIPWIARRGRYVYNFWQDAAHPKGLWRRTTLAEYRNPHPAWDVLIDVDALAREEGVDWVWRGCVALPPHYQRGLVRLSRGGADAAATREFDLDAKRFVEGGFSLPEAKGDVGWLDADTLLVAMALGGEAFQTVSGYPRTVRRWRRGTPFADAPVVFDGAREHMFIYGWRDHDPATPRTFFARRLDFIEHELFLEGPANELVRVDVPRDCGVAVDGDLLLLTLRSEWAPAARRYPAGALLAISFDAFMAGNRDLAVLFEPDPGRFLEGASTARDVVAFNVLDHVRSRVYLARRERDGWRTEQVASPSEQAVLSVAGLDTNGSDRFAEGEGADFVLYSDDALTPPAVSLVRYGHAPEPLKSMPARFDAAELAVTQHEALADDGTRVPYFQVGPRETAAGPRPTLLTGYGGFQISSLPHYALGAGKLWLARGGVHVIANIRGGGEFGPDWHKAGMREGKKRSHDDFAAIAKDLIARGVAAPSSLACWGGSNGGLLVGNMLTRYPDLFGAIICAVPLLDMRRYTKLTAGPSWIAEYGDPDKPEDWAFLKEISAYQNIVAGRRYPPILLTTSARDDRVHPGHARKMAAKLKAIGAPAFFYEPPEGGHGGATDNAHLAFNMALGYAFLRHTIAPEMTGA